MRETARRLKRMQAHPKFYEFMQRMMPPLPRAFVQRQRRQFAYFLDHPKATYKELSAID
jgi:hypothetical protein